MGAAEDYCKEKTGQAYAYCIQTYNVNNIDLVAENEAYKEKKKQQKLVEAESEGVLNPTFKELNNSNPTPDEFREAIEHIKSTSGLTSDFVDQEILNYAAANGFAAGTSPFAVYIDEEGAFRDVQAIMASPRAAEPAFIDKYREKNINAGDAAALPVAGLEDSLDDEATTEERVSLTQQTYQCYLLHNIEALAEFHRNKFNDRMAPNSPAELKAPFFIERTGDQRILLVDDSHPDGAYFATNKLTSLGKTKGISEVKPHEIAQLMPKLRIYKIYRENTGGLEYAKVELEFDNYTDTGFLDQVRDPGGGFAKGEGAGIKSFDWSFIGGDPFTATRDLTATIKLYFQDFQDLIKVRVGRNKFFPDMRNQYRYLDLVLQGDCRDVRRTIAGLEEEARAENLGYEVYHPECYEIAVEVGYADVSKVSGDDMSSSTKEAIKKQSDTIYLTMTDHTFDIGQDGTFELTVNYRARLSSFLGDKGMNVLLPGGGYAVETEGVNGEGSLQWSMLEVEDMIKEERKKAKDGTTKKNERLKKLEVLREIIIAKSTISMHSGIMKSLFAKKMVYQTTISHEEFNKFSFFGQIDRTNKDSIYVTDWDLDTDSGMIAGIDNYGPACPEASEIGSDTDSAAEGELFTSLAPKESQKKRIGEVKEDHKIFFTTLGDIIGIVTDHVLGEAVIYPGGGLTNPRIKSWIDGIMSGDNEERSWGQNATDRIATGFNSTSQADFQLEEFGEKFDEGLAAPETGTGAININSTQANLMERFRVILGTLAYKGTVDDQVHSINLAHMPISLESFQSFFVDNVISTNRTFYSYQDFVRDLLTDLILKNMSRECFGGYFESSVKAGISLLNAQGTSGNKSDDEGIPKSAGFGNDPITNHDDLDIYGPRDINLTYNVLKLKNSTEANPIFTNIESQDVKNFDYMLFSAHSVQGFAGSLDGVESSDLDLGIPHFRFGQTTGFLKSANFSKTPIEYLAEERYVREGSSNMLNQLAGKYEMQLNMVGNSIFQPGQYIYFDPVAMGVGKSNENKGGEARSYANRMGLGGYHIITEVGNSISVGKFETTIKALWDTSGKPTGTEQD